MVDYVGEKCAGCQKRIFGTEKVAVCACGAVYHESCWVTLKNCKNCGGMNPNYDPISDAKNIYFTAKQKAEENAPLSEPQPYSVHPSASEKLRLNILHGDGTGLFSNIAGKIQTLAVIIAIVGAVLGVLTFIVSVFIGGDMVLPGLLIGIVIAVLSWAGTFTLYGFGTLIKSEQASAEYLYKIMNALEKDE